MHFLETIDKTLSNPITKPALWFWDRYKRNKIKLLREIILRDVRQGDFSGVASDDLIGISYRLHKDVLEGVAKNNLRLLCSLISGLNERKELSSSNFLKFATILEGLTDKEIKLLAYEIWPLFNKEPKYSDKTSVIKTKNDTTHFYECEAHKKWKENKELFIKCLGNIGGHQELKYALLRTGLYCLTVRTSTKVEVYEDGSGNDAESYTEIRFQQSSLMKELIPYIKNILLELKFD